jgi:amino acid transporter
LPIAWTAEGGADHCAGAVNSGYYVFLPDAFNATDFIFAYGSVFIFVALLIGYKAWDVVVRHRTTIILKTDEIDFHEGLEEIEAMTERAETKRASKPRTRWQRTVDRIF